MHRVWTHTPTDVTCRNAGCNVRRQEEEMVPALRSVLSC